MGWPKGMPCPEETRLKIRETQLRRCANPKVKAAWKATDAAQRFWFARVNQHRPDWPVIHSKGD